MLGWSWRGGMPTHYPIARHRDLRPYFRWSTLCQVRRPLAVSLVDLRRDVPFRFNRHVSAAEPRRSFIVSVTYRCTVTDPVAVVRARHTPEIQDLSTVLAQDLMRTRLDRAHAAADDPGLLAALKALLQRQAHEEIPGVRVALARVDVPPAGEAPVHPITEDIDDSDIGEARRATGHRPSRGSAATG